MSIAWYTEIEYHKRYAKNDPNWYTTRLREYRTLASTLSSSAALSAELQKIFRCNDSFITLAIRLERVA